MIQSKELSLKSIISSREGVHLTSYIENRGTEIEIKRQIQESIDVATEHLSTIMPKDELMHFLSPIRQLLFDPNTLKRFRANIGMFRTRDSFRMLNIPVDVEHLCVVATSFHVKPLLRWIQLDKDFLVLGLEKDSATLYVANQSSCRHIDTIYFPEDLKNGNFSNSHTDFGLKVMDSAKLDENIEWINEWLDESTGRSKMPLFLAGDPRLVKRLLLGRQFARVRKSLILNAFDRNRVIEVVSEVRNLLQKEFKERLERSIVEFYWAEDMKLGKKNIFQIAKAAARGKIRKLIVADGIQIFGKMDKLTGGLIINPAHLDHEDDDLLDDLAQSVLASGGEVIVVPRDQIPKGRPILAILREDHQSGLEVKAPETDGVARVYA